MGRHSLFFTVFAVVVVGTAIGYLPRRIRPRSRAHFAATTAMAAGADAVARPYFSDRDRVAQAIIAAINHTRSSLHIAIYSFTDRRIEAAMAAAAERGVSVRVVADESQASYRNSEIPYLQRRGIAVRLSGGYRGQQSIMHDKFAIFDDASVETGSFNWTISAEDYNYENVVFLSDPSVVARYEEEFERIWSRAR